MGMKALVSDYGISDRVLIDKDDSIVARVTEIMFRAGEEADYEVSWMNNGEVKYARMPAWRLTEAK